jgi:hypothetical protein
LALGETELEEHLMGSDWIKCTLQAGKDKAVWINLALAVSIVEHKGGSRISFCAGDDEETIDVKEEPELLLGLEEEEEEENAKGGEKDEEGEAGKEKEPEGDEKM